MALATHSAARASTWASVALLGAALGLGCSAGRGEGEIEGSIFSEDCLVDAEQYTLVPSLFTGEVTGQALDMRVQRGSANEAFADGVRIHVGDINDVRDNRIGLPIELADEPGSLVQVTFYLNESCLSGFPSEYRQRPLILAAQSGQVTFNSIYAPEIDPANTEIAAELTDVEFVDPSDPSGRFGRLSGWFSFFFQRGRPAQRFP